MNIKKLNSALVLACLLAANLSQAAETCLPVNNPNFSLVIGQPSFTTQVNTPAYLYESSGIAWFNNRLYVSDTLHYRVLVYASLPGTGAYNTPIAVIGQPNFTQVSKPSVASAKNLMGPGGLAISQDGLRLFVCDGGANRIMIYDLPTLPATGATAAGVIGQGNFTGAFANRGASISALGLNNPSGLAVSATDLYVADTTNSRVLRYSIAAMPLPFGSAANLVIGQGNMNTLGGGVGATRMTYPVALSIEGTRLAIADNYNSRVLVYNTLPTANNAAADRVLGQPNMATSTFMTIPGIDNLLHPQGVLLSGGKLIVSDSQNHRVVTYMSVPALDGSNADWVIGQADFTHNLFNQSGSALPNDHGLSNLNGLSGGLAGLATDGSRLFISDPGNSRVVAVDCFGGAVAAVTPTYIPTPLPPVVTVATPCVLPNGSSFGLVIGQGDFVSRGSGGATNFAGDSAIVFAGSRFFVADSQNHRVLVYDNLPTGGAVMNPVAVIGQNSFSAKGARNVSAYSVTSPNGLAVSADGTKLFVSQGTIQYLAGHRISIFDLTHLATFNTPAIGVIGQADFGQGSPNRLGPVGANTLSNPAGIAVAGNMLYVADHGNHRVLGYDLNTLPMPFGAVASRVLGQPNFSSATYYSVAANTFNQPFCVASDGVRLAISDQGLNRVLVYNSLPTLNNQAASFVLGQPNMSSFNAASPNPATPNSLFAPAGLIFDHNRLVVSDTYNYRVLIYAPVPSVNGAAASSVIGQPDFSSRLGGQGVALPTNYALYNAGSGIMEGLASDGNRLLITDSGNNRVVAFGCPVASTPTLTSTTTWTKTSTSTSTPSATPTHSSTATPSSTTTWTPSFTPSATPSSTPSSTMTESPSSTLTSSPTSSQTQSFTSTWTPTATSTITQTPDPCQGCAALYCDNFESDTVGSQPSGWTLHSQVPVGYVKVKAQPNPLNGQSIEMASEFDKWLSIKADAPQLQNLGDTVVTVKSVVNHNLLLARIHDDGSGYWNGGGFCKNCYVFQTSAYDGLWLFKIVNGVYQPMVSAPLPAGVALNQLADFRFEVTGNQLTGYINNSIAIQTTDIANSHPQGTAGLSVLGYGVYDDFKVNPLPCGTSTFTLSSTPSNTPTATLTNTPDPCQGCAALYCDNFESDSVDTAPSGWAMQGQNGSATALVKAQPNPLNGQSVEMNPAGHDQWMSIIATAPQLQNLANTVVTVKSVLIHNLLLARVHDNGTGMFNGGGFCQNCYVFQTSGYDGLWLFKIVNGIYQPMVSAPLPAGVALNQLADFRFEVTGNQLTGYINNSIAIQTVDAANSHPQGTAGLAVLGYGIYDDFKVNPLPCGTSTFTLSSTPSHTPSLTATQTATRTSTPSPSPTATSSQTQSFSSTWTPTSTATQTVDPCLGCAALYCDPFESDNLGALPAGWSFGSQTALGEATVVNGMNGQAFQIRDGGGDAWISAKADSPSLAAMTDTVFEASTTFNESLILARIHDTGTGYFGGGFCRNCYAFQAAQGAGAQLFKLIEGVYHPLASGSMPAIPQGNLLNLRLEVIGTQLTAYVNGSIVLQANDVENSHPQGTVGLQALRYGIFDNVKVNPLPCGSSTQTLSATPTPTRTLTATQSATGTFTATLTDSPTLTATETASPTPTNTPVMSGCYYSSIGDGLYPAPDSTCTCWQPAATGSSWAGPHLDAKSAVANEVFTVSRQIEIPAGTDLSLVQVMLAVMADDNFSVTINGQVWANCTNPGGVSPCMNRVPQLVPASFLQIGTNTFDFTVSDTFYGYVAISYSLCWDLNPGAPAAPMGIQRLAGKATEPSWSLPDGKSFVIAPNPAGNEAQAFIDLKAAGKARLLISNAAGELVQSDELGNLAAGKHRLALHLQNLASGLYFALLQSDDGFGYATRQSFKLAILK